MEESKKNNLDEQLRKIKHRFDYKINESVRYRPLVNQDEQFDNLPVEIYNTDDGQPVPKSPAFTNEAGDQEDAPKPGGGMPPAAPSNDLPVDMNAPPAGAGGAPAPEGQSSATPGEEPPAEELPAEISASGKETPAGPENMPQGPEGMPPIGPEMGGVQQVDDIQNDIIKHNIAAMKSIHDELEGLNATVQGLNSKLENLNAEVEEVREPTNTEKLMNKTNVSYPYYFNLNDFWQGNWFNQKREKEHEQGIRELPDGSFIADFDELPQKSKTDVQNSFNEFSESTKKKNILKEGFAPGMKVQVSDGSGLDSNKIGTIVSPREVKTSGDGVPTNIQGAYKPVDWSREVAVRLDDGSLITMFKNRLKVV